MVQNVKSNFQLINFKNSEKYFKIFKVNLKTECSNLKILELRLLIIMKYNLCLNQNRSSTLLIFVYLNTYETYTD